MDSQPPAVTASGLITGFGSAALTRALVEHLRRRGSGRCTILTPHLARAADLWALLESEGIAEAQVLTYTRYAADLAGRRPVTVASGAQRWLLFHRAWHDLPAGVKQALARDGAQAESVWRLLDSLRANFVPSSHLTHLRDSHPLAGLLADLLGLYENMLRDRDVADTADLVRAALEKISQGSGAPAGHCVFDSTHEVRPDEFELAAALAGTGGACVFLCDADAPAPEDRAVVGDVTTKLARRLGQLETQAAPAPPGEALGRKIADGSLDSLGEGAQLLQFNDLASQFRGLAQDAHTLMLEEGVPAREMAFYLGSTGSQAGLLCYELERTRVLEGTGGHGFLGSTAGLEREVRLILGLLTDPERPGLKRRAVLAGMAPDDSQLEAKLAELIAGKETLSLEELLASALVSLIPDRTQLEEKALDLWRACGAQFAALAGTGRADEDLPLLAGALDGYVRELAGENPDSNPCPQLLITPDRPAAKFYSVVFLPSLVRKGEPPRPELRGVRELAGALERTLGRPVYLPSGRTRDARRRWEAGTAAAAGARAVLSFHRQEGGRPARPATWLQGVMQSAQSRPVVEFTGGPAHPPAPAIRIAAPSVLSTSAIADYVACPHLFYLRRILRLKGPESEYMALGLLVHRVLAQFHAPGQADFSAGQIHRLLDEVAAGAALVPESLAEAGALLGAYAAEPAIGAEETVAVERRFKLELGGAQIRGRIDRIVAVEDGVKVIDYKTRGRGKERKHKNAAVARLEDIQLPLYTLAARGMGHQVSAFSYIYLNHDDTGRPYEARLRFAEEEKGDAISAAELQASLGRIEGVVREILAGKYEYEKGENAPCRRQAGWCEFSGMCTLAGE